MPRKTKIFQSGLRPLKRRGFAASPKDTATAEQNQRFETRHIGTSTGAFRVRLPQFCTLCSFKIEVFLRVFLWTSNFATAKSMFRARIPSFFSTSHKTPHKYCACHTKLVSKTLQNMLECHKVPHLRGETRLRAV